MAVPQVGTPGATFKQKAKGSHDRRGDTVQAATRTGASEHLGSLPGFALAFRGTYLSFLCLSFSGAACSHLCKIRESFVDGKYTAAMAC